MSKIDVMIGLAGTAPVEWEGIAALLDDHLDRYGDDATVRYALPVSPYTVGDTEKLLAKYVEVTEEDYEVVLDDSQLTRWQSKLVDHAVDEHESDNVVHGLVGRLVAVQQAGSEAVLILALGEEDAADDLTLDLLEEAAEHQITVLDLTHGLEEVHLRHPDDKPTAQKDERTTDMERSTGLVLAEDELILVRTIIDAAVSIMDNAAATYNHLGGLGIDPEINYERMDRIAEGHKLIVELREILDRQDPGPVPETAPEPVKPARKSRAKKTEPAEEPEDKPAKRTRRSVRNGDETNDAPVGKPRRTRRAAAEDTDDESGEETVKVVRLANGAYKAFGRGRRPAGAEVVEIPLAQFERLDLSS